MQAGPLPGDCPQREFCFSSTMSWIVSSTDLGHCARGGQVSTGLWVCAINAVPMPTLSHVRCRKAHRAISSDIRQRGRAPSSREVTALVMLWKCAGACPYGPPSRDRSAAGDGTSRRRSWPSTNKNRISSCTPPHVPPPPKRWPLPRSANALRRLSSSIARSHDIDRQNLLRLTWMLKCLRSDVNSQK